MSRGLRWVMASIATCAFLLPAYGVDNTETPNVMSVLVCERTEVNAQTLQAAERTVSHVFYKAGIRVTWVLGCVRAHESRSHFVIVIGDKPPLGWISPNAMGFAPIRTGDQRRAYVFLDRVRLFVDLAAPRDTRRSLGIALGYTIAHELGHLLIPGRGHTVSGIMSPTWSHLEWQDALQGRLVFLPEQAKIMQKSLGE
jgi:hypothetical protein